VLGSLLFIESRSILHSFFARFRLRIVLCAQGPRGRWGGGLGQRDSERARIGEHKPISHGGEVSFVQSPSFLNLFLHVSCAGLQQIGERILSHT
jgi:hypothetical protein